MDRRIFYFLLQLIYNIVPISAEMDGFFFLISPPMYLPTYQSRERENERVWNVHRQNTHDFGHG